MVKIFISLILLLVSACGSRELNINSLDLSRYATQPDSFPAYVELMKPGNPGVVPAEVAEISKFFADKSQVKQLFLIGQLGTEVDARIYAMARHDTHSQVIEIRLDTLNQDSKAQAWTEIEYSRVLDAVLSKNNSENTVFFLENFDSTKLGLVSAYRAIIVPSHPEQELFPAHLVLVFEN